MFLNNPILGVGQGNFPWNFEEAQGAERFNTRSLAGRAAHSMYFTLIPELGLIGTGLFFGIILSNYLAVRRVRLLFRKPKPVTVRDSQQDEVFALATSNSLEAAMVGYLASSVFISTLYYPTFWVLTGLVVALENSTRSVDKPSSGDNSVYPVLSQHQRPIRLARSRRLSSPS
jgi:O-antigen ligase